MRNKLKHTVDAKPKTAIRSPAICLIAVAVFSILVLAIGIVFDASIVAVSLNHRSNVYQHALTRIPFAIILALINVQVIRGAWGMLRLRRYKAAKQAAIIAMIPCASPCFLLGIPFGIWALSVLNDSNVKDSFGSND